METISLEQGLALKQLGEDLYQLIERPWTWPNSTVVPGGLLMSAAAAAAYETVPADFAIDTLQTYFVSGPKPDAALVAKVQRLSNSGRFMTRVVSVEQSGVPMVHVTCSFVRLSAMQGNSLTHCVARQTNGTVDKITEDDLDPARISKQGPYMKFQRLPLFYTGPSPAPSKPPPNTLVYTSAAIIHPPITSTNPRHQALGIITLSDYHILDAPPTLHKMELGSPILVTAKQRFKMQTSLNHNIRFRIHEGFRADDMCYIEVTSPWTDTKRAEVQSRIFDRNGVLVATCVQETYHVLKDEGSKL